MAPSFQRNRRKRQTRTFYGREEHIKRLRENLDLDAEERECVFFVYGNAGVGKSLLLNEFRSIVERKNALVVRVDATHTNDVVDTLHAMADQLKQQGVKVGEFDKRHAEYVRRRHELLSDKDAPEGISGVLAHGIVQGGALGVRMAGAGPIVDQVNTAKAAEGLDKAFSYVKGRFTEHQDLRLVLDPTAELTRILTKELGKGLDGRMFALFVDTFEVAAPPVAAWLARLLLTEDYGELPIDFLLTVAGQNRPDPNIWSELGDLRVDIELEAFSRSETVGLLEQRRVTDPKIAEQIWKDTLGLPVLVDTLAQTSPESAEDLPDHSGEAMERFLKWFKEPEQRLVAQLGALPLELDQDVLAVLLPEKSKPKAAELYRWLRTQPFTSDRSGRCQYHQVVRSLMVRIQRNSSPMEFRHLHALLAEHFENIDEQGIQTNLFYHRLCAEPIEHLPQALNITVILAQQEPELRLWVTKLDQAGRDSDDSKIQSWATRLTGCLEKEDARHATLSTLIEKADLPKDHLARALRERWKLSHRKRLYRTALKDISQSLELEPEYEWAIAMRALTHGSLGEYKKAISDYTRAIDIAPEDHWNRAHRGDAYKRLGQLENALADLDKAIELKPDYARAIANRGSIQHALGNLPQALRDLDRAIEISPEYIWAIQRRMVVNGDLGNTQETHDDLNTLLHQLQQDPQSELDPWHCFLAGISHQKRGQKRKADIRFTQGVSLGNKERANGDLWDGSHFNPAMCHIGLGENDEGLSLIREMLDRGTDQGNIREALTNLRLLRSIIVEHLAEQLDAYDQVIRLLAEELGESA